MLICYEAIETISYPENGDFSWVGVWKRAQDK